MQWDIKSLARINYKMTILQISSLNFINVLVKGFRRFHRVWRIHFIDLVVRNFLGTSRLDVDLLCSRWKECHRGKIETSIVDDRRFYIESRSDYDDVTTARLFPFLYWYRQIFIMSSYRKYIVLFMKDSKNTFFDV